MAECIEVMAEALRALAKGDAMLPLRTVMRLPDGRSAFAAMPAFLGSPAAMGIKVLTVFPGNEGTSLDSHQGAVLLFEAEQGRLVSIMDASSITSIRTAAVSAVATSLLARENATRLAILGAGVQALTHIESMRAVRPIERVTIWSRHDGRAIRLSRKVRERFGLDARVVGAAIDAVADADIVCTTTSSREPVLEGAWLMPGVHVNAIGASLPSARELDSEAVRRSRLFVDRRESTRSEAGDFLIPLQEGVIGEDHIAGEIGELLLGQVDGRRSAEEVTVFKSLGLAIEDLASAHHVYQRAIAEGIGTSVELGGERHE
jgi:ornithine cyclodeaminase/alanine dehydrogenase-like protein (mu-crystallin family)